MRAAMFSTTSRDRDGEPALSAPLLMLLGVLIFYREVCRRKSYTMSTFLRTEYTFLIKDRFVLTAGTMSRVRNLAWL